MIKIIAYIKALYSSAWSRADECSIEIIVTSWLDVLQEFSAELVFSAIKQFVKDTPTEFAPTASQIYRLCWDIKNARNRREWDHVAHNRLVSGKDAQKQLDGAK